MFQRLIQDLINISRLIRISKHLLWQSGLSAQEYQSFYGKPLPARGNLQNVGEGQAHKREIIAFYLREYLAPTVCKMTNHSRETAERYVRDFEAARMAYSKFNDVEIINRTIRLSKRVVNQYVDLIPLKE